VSGKPTSPVLEPRDAAAFARETIARLPAYVPGWRPTSSDAGNAVAQVYARYLKSLADRVNQAPDKHKLAFLDMLGVDLLPAQAARAPMVFTAIPAVGDSRIPERTRVGAKVEGQTNPLIFETDDAIALASAHISQVVTLWPGRDAYADHTAAVLHGDSFTLFDTLVPVSHELYLSHDTQLALVGQSMVELHVEIASPGSAPLAPVWEYWDGVAWRPFKPFVSGAKATMADSLDGTTGLTRSGVIRLVSACATTASCVVDGVSGLWIRSRLAVPLLPANGLRLPEIERISLNSVIDRSLPTSACAMLGDAIGIVPQSAYAADQKLDLTKAVQILGPNPQIGSAFWVQCDEAFAKAGAQVTLCFRKVETPEEKADKDNAKFEADVKAAQALVVASARLDAWALIRIANAAKDINQSIPDVTAFDQAVTDVGTARDALAGLGINGIAALETATKKLVAQLQTVIPGFAFPPGSLWDLTLLGLNPLWVLGDIASEVADFYSQNLTRIQNSYGQSLIAAEDIDASLGYLAQLTPTSAAMAAGGTLPLMATPVVVWEYWNGSAWRTLSVSGTANALSFRGDGPVTFTVPGDMYVVDHAGTTARWIRARLVSGGYGLIRVTSWKDEASGKLNYFPIIETRPPTMDRVQLGYVYRSPRVAPEHCRTFNDFAFANRDLDVRTVSTPFEPFSFVADTTPALYLGFDAPLPADQLGLFLDIEEVIGETSGPDLVWEYHDGTAWSALRVEDDTYALALPGMVKVLWPGVPALPSVAMASARTSLVQLDNARAAAAFAAGDRVVVTQKGSGGELATIARVRDDTLELEAPLAKTYSRGSIAIAPFARFGTPATWLRARLAHDGEPRRSRIDGLYLNATWASQLQTVENEVLGASNGEPEQLFFFRNAPVLEGETIEVRELEGARAKVEEPILREELARLGVPDSDIRLARDPRTGDVNELWVTWHEQPNLFFASPTARVYTIERSRGRLLFGGAGTGLAPVAAADNVVARRYRSGGGTIGNVSRGAITQLLAGVLAQSVSNPRAAEGGADGQPIQDVLARGSAIVHHRRQAITAADYEALARDASPAVAVARALPTTHPSGRFAPGWVTMLIVPRSTDARPVASFELRDRVRRFLSARAPASVATQIAVIPAAYYPVGVTIAVSPLDQSSAGIVAQSVTTALATFLHPLTGGPDGNGWPFGRDIFLSDVAALVESVPGVDFATSISLLVNGTPAGERVAVPSDRIVVAGVIRVSLFGGEG
jgi:hypothetical protein